MYQKDMELNCISIHTVPKVNMYYGQDIHHLFPEIVCKWDFDKIFLVMEPTIYQIHGKLLYQTMQQKKLCVELILMPVSEKEKTFHTLEHLCSMLLENKISHDSLVIGFGGGVLTNITGLAAALLYRGVNYVEIPTTFLGQTDSALSNKQAVNGSCGKNQVGTFYAPLFIWSDLAYTKTESARNFNAGIVEGIKNAFISNADLLSYFQDPAQFAFDHVLDMFETITNAKNKILEQDPTEKKRSIILEYGHTFGHAIEFLSKGAVIHGEAVAMGMCMAAQASYRIGGLSQKDVQLHYELLERFFYTNPESQIPDFLHSKQIYQALCSDNKRTKYGIPFVLLSQIGTCMNTNGTYSVTLPDEVIIDAITDFLNVYANLAKGESIAF